MQGCAGPCRTWHLPVQRRGGPQSATEESPTATQNTPGALCPSLRTVEPWACLLIPSPRRTGPVQPGRGCASPLRPQAPGGGGCRHLVATLTHVSPAFCYPTGCSKMWDNLTCWPATPRGQVVVLACPLIYSFFSPLEGKSPGLKLGSCVAQVEPGRVGSHLSGK